MNSVVFVAGASRGIGHACVEAFLATGAHVVAVSRTIDETQRTPHLLPLRADLTDPEAAQRAAATARKEFGSIHVVIHCVGDVPVPSGTRDIDWQRWRATLDLCLGSAVHVVASTYDDVVANRGSYTFVSSVGATKPYPGIADYCAAKAALSSFARSVALDLAPSRARANVVHPAVVETDILRRAPFTKEDAASWHKLGRVGRPDEIARACVYLSSPEAGWITGQALVLDGGMTL